MSFNTTDICDELGDNVEVAIPMFSDFGGSNRFSGVISTVKCHEDNSRVREALGEPGAGRVLVVDGGGSLRCALLGDMLAALGRDNGWAGVLAWSWAGSPFAALPFLPWTVRMRIGEAIEPEDLFGDRDWAMTAYRELAGRMASGAQRDRFLASQDLRFGERF